MKTKKYWILAVFVAAIVVATCWTANVSRPAAGSIQQISVAKEQQDTLVGLQGVLVVLEEVPPEVSKYGLTKETLQRDTELRLLQNGIAVLTEDELFATLGYPTLYINVSANVLRLTPKQLDLLERQYPIFKEMRVRGKTIEELGIASVFVSIRLGQAVLLVRDSNVICPSAITWEVHGVVSAAEYKLKEMREIIKEYIDTFINDYLAANPKEQRAENKYGEKTTEDSQNFLSEIHDAAENGNLDKLKAILHKKPELLNAKDKSSWTPLHLAALEDQKGAVNLLLAKGAQVNVRDELGYTPLHWAAFRGHKGVCMLLLTRGAEVNAKDNDGVCPLQSAASMGHENVIEFLLDNGAMVQAKDKHGDTPLHWACLTGQKEVCMLLLARGAKVNAKNNGGATPLHSACGMGHENAVEFLLDKGAMVEAKDKRGDTPLHWAAVMGNKEVCMVLLAGGAKVNANNDSGLTPMDLAVVEGDKEVIELLSKYGEFE